MPLFSIPQGYEVLYQCTISCTKRPGAKWYKIVDLKISDRTLRFGIICSKDGPESKVGAIYT